MASEKVMKETGKHISVLNGRSISGGQGLQVLRVARAIEKGWSHDEIVRQFDKWATDTEALVSVRSMKQIVKSGRVSPLKGWIARILGIKPIIAVDKEGKTFLLDRTFTQIGNMKKVVQRIQKMTDGIPVWNYVLLHANNPDGAQWFQNHLRSVLKKEPLATMNVSPVIGAHVGNKTVAVIFMYE